MLKLLALFVAVTSTALAATLPCYQCATLGLLNNWEITGYTQIPSNITFDEICRSDPTTAMKVDCDGGICIEMAVPTSSNTWEFLRGCHPHLAGTNTNLTLTAAPVGTPRCSQLKLENKAENIFKVCTPTDENVACNGGMQQKTPGTLTGIVGSGQTCTEVSAISCITCTSYDGKGKCSSGEKSRANGQFCAKTKGKLNGHDYVERGPTTIIPTELKEYCTPIADSKTLQFGPVAGTTITRTKRSLNQVFNGQICYCSQAGCNSAPTVVRASLSLVALLAALPFFC